MPPRAPRAVLQATAIAFGANHTAALLLTSNDNRGGHHSLYTVGRGAQGGCRRARTHAWRRPAARRIWT